jgi:hypothetical protein
LLYDKPIQDEKGEYSLAMGLYENALEALLKVHNKSQGRKKELLREEVFQNFSGKIR